METTEKQYKFAAVEAEENGFRVQKSNLSNDKINIYKLQLGREDELRLKYFISEKNREQMLKLSFELLDNKPQQQILIEEIIKSIEFK